MFTTSDQKLARIAADRHAVFALADARAVGLTDRQIEWRMLHCWQRFYQGVYGMPGAPVTQRSRLLAAALAGGDGAAASHRSAAWLYELPGRRDDIVEITCPRWLRARHSDLVVHEQRRFAPKDLTVVDMIPVVRPELAVMQLAWWKPSPHYVEAVIHAARRRRLITYESTIEVFRRHARRGLRGVRAMRIALERWHPGDLATESERETRLLQVLRDNGYTGVVQHEIRDDHGTFVARVDAALPRYRIAVEYQSKQEHMDEFQVAADDRRRNRVTAAGWHVICVRSDDLAQPHPDFIDQIRTIARRQAG